MSYFTHLECSVPCGAGPYDPRQEQHLCALRRSPARPLRSRAGAGVVARVAASREPNMWRYRELMPLFDGESAADAGRRLDAALHGAAAWRRLGLERLFVKDESLNPDELVQGPRPVRRGHARGVSSGARRCRSLPPATPPTRWPRTPPRPESRPRSSCRRDVKVPFIRECELYGATSPWSTA